MCSLQAHNRGDVALLVITALLCVVSTHNLQESIYYQDTRNVGPIYSHIQKSYVYPPKNISDLYYKHYGQSQLESNSISDTVVDPYQQEFREDKQLSPFTLVQFANSECTSSDNSLTGTCYSFWDCWRGTSGSSVVNYDWRSCAGGFGICCTSVLGCGGSSSNNNTWLRSPGYPSTFNSGLDCQQTIFIEEDICQLRLEIEDLSLDYPDSTGSCPTDYLTVSQDTKFDRLCGVTKDNHFYLDVMHSMSNQVTFNFHTDSSVSFDRSWSIRISKICCHSDEEVPRGCGQYYTGTSGTIKSLNYEAPNTDDYVLSGLNYAACVRMENGYCKNTYDETMEGLNDAWVTICPDIFERPGRPDNGGNFLPIIKCQGEGVGGTTAIAHPYTYSYLSPHLFKLDTTQSTTNIHNSGDSLNNGGTYYIKYQQTKC